MRNSFEQLNNQEQQDAENITDEQPIQQETRSEQVPIEERVDGVLEKQDNEISRQEAKHDKKTLSGFKKFMATTMLVGSSFLAVGCNAEKPSVENSAPQKTESRQGGFTDNVHDNVQQRLKIKRAEIKHMHENSRIVK